MPVRKIPKNYLHVTGSFASQKNGRMLGFESLLEKEYMTLMEFDEAVDHFEEQPTSIPIPGSSQSYTPDLLVHFRAIKPHAAIPRPLLIEIKHTSDLAKNGHKYASKFAAAKSYAEKNGWEFIVITEKEIRTPRLANLKFLREFRNIYPKEGDITAVLEVLKSAKKKLTFHEIKSALHSDTRDVLSWIPIIWHLVITRKLMVDMDRPLTDETPFWLP